MLAFPPSTKGRFKRPISAHDFWLRPTLPSIHTKGRSQALISDIHFSSLPGALGPPASAFRVGGLGMRSGTIQRAPFLRPFLDITPRKDADCHEAT